MVNAACSVGTWLVAASDRTGRSRVQKWAVKHLLALFGCMSKGKGRQGGDLTRKGAACSRKRSHLGLCSMARKEQRCSYQDLLYCLLDKSKIGMPSKDCPPPPPGQGLPCCLTQPTGSVALCTSFSLSGIGPFQRQNPSFLWEDSESAGQAAHTSHFLKICAAFSVSNVQDISLLQKF